MDLSKLNLPASTQSALSVAAAIVSKTTKGFTITKTVSCNSEQNVQVLFESVLSMHQELIEALESSGHQVIDGSTELLTSAIKHAIGTAKKYSQKQINDKLIVLYSAAWVQGLDNDAETIVVDYHLIMANEVENNHCHSSIHTISMGKLPLTQGIVIQDNLIMEYIDEMNGSEGEDN